MWAALALLKHRQILEAKMPCFASAIATVFLVKSSARAHACMSMQFPYMFLETSTRTVYELSSR
jgi:hypothetical protein